MPRHCIACSRHYSMRDWTPDVQSPAFGELGLRVKGSKTAARPLPAPSTPVGQRQVAAVAGRCVEHRPDRTDLTAQLDLTPRPPNC